MSGFDVNPPRTPGARAGDEFQREFLKEAEHDRLAHEAERIHEEEASEGGETPAKRPWWKFWA
jgi:hypothetical protein